MMWSFSLQKYNAYIDISIDSFLKDITFLQHTTIREFSRQSNLSLPLISKNTETVFSFNNNNKILDTY